MALDSGRVAPSRGLNRIDDLTPHILTLLKRHVDPAIIGQPHPEDDEPGGLWTDPAEPQARALRDIWANSVRRASHDDYLKWRLAHLDADQCPRDLSAWLEAVVRAKEQKARPSHLNLIAAGNVGSGKTVALAALGNEAAERGLTARFIKHSTYLTWRRPDSAPDGITAHQVRDWHVGCDLLVLDELCGEMDGGATEFARRETTDLIDSRIAAGRPTAYSTNLNREQVERVLGQRLLSRLEHRAHLVRIVGPDRRKPVKPLDW